MKRDMTERFMLNGVQLRLSQCLVNGKPRNLRHQILSGEQQSFRHQLPASASEWGTIDGQGTATLDTQDIYQNAWRSAPIFKTPTPMVHEPERVSAQGLKNLPKRVLASTQSRLER